MSNDIAARLRDIEGGYGFRAICREAADEIERLREELTASHESHGNEVGALTERLSLAIHERDEARRKICEIESRGTCDPQKYADLMGWDCFTEVGHDR